MKKLFTILICVLILLVGAAYFIFTDDKVVSIITLDINPSVEISLDRYDKVKKVEALNEDAKSIISEDLNDKSLEEAIESITENVIEKGFVHEDQVVVLIHAKGNVKNDEVKRQITEKFNEKQVKTEVITIDAITKEDEELAEQYHISPAKASYIKSITDENEHYTIDDLSGRSVEELQERKTTGNYCNGDDKLEGDRCAKEISRTKATLEEACPPEYYELEGKCYKETHTIETGLRCPEPYVLRNGKCDVEDLVDAQVDKYTCSSGTFGLKSDVGLANKGSGDDSYICYDVSTAKAPTLRCLSNSGHIMIDGKCYNGPAPLINGGCPGADIAVNGWCYSKDDEDQWLCPDGRIYEKSKNSVPKYCPDTIKYTKATIDSYKCENGVLEGNKCRVVTRTEDALIVMGCPTGYRMLDDGRCISDETSNKETRYVCEEDETIRFEDGDCVKYEFSAALHD